MGPREPSARMPGPVHAKYLTREVVRGGRGQPVERSVCFVDEWKLGNVPSGSCEEIAIGANTVIAKLTGTGKLRM